MSTHSVPRDDSVRWLRRLAAWSPSYAAALEGVGIPPEQTRRVLRDECSETIGHASGPWRPPSGRTPDSMQPPDGKPGRTREGGGTATTPPGLFRHPQDTPTSVDARRQTRRRVVVPATALPSAEVTPNAGKDLLANVGELGHGEDAGRRRPVSWAVRSNLGALNSPMSITGGSRWLTSAGAMAASIIRTS